MKKQFFFLFLVVISLPVLGQKAKTIVLSKIYGKGEYEAWLHRVAPDVKLVSLFHVRRDSIDFWLKAADGILMTGGEDVYPAWYGKEKDTADCGTFDRWRDSLEMKILDHAFAFKKPLFGICRGLQIINVHQKGTLVVDIPSRIGVRVRHREDGPVEHEVELLPGNRLFKNAKTKRGKILSNHHQGIDVLGKNLIPIAKSDDGLLEAFEGNEASKMPFLMAVQWHPEKMESENPLSKSLAELFVNAVLKAGKEK
jgi:putative glutamine amidotransferase